MDPIKLANRQEARRRQALREITELAQELGHIPRRYEYETWAGSTVSDVTLLSRAGVKTWPELIEAAGFDPDQLRSVSPGLNATDDELLADLTAHFERTGNATVRSYGSDPAARYSPHHIIDRFERWSEARAKIGALGYTRYSDEDILQALKECAERLGHTPTGEELEADELIEFALSTVRDHFGTLSAAQRKAGLVPTKNRGRRVEDQEMHRDLLQCAARLGRWPSQRDFDADPLTRFASDTIAKRFDGWVTAREVSGVAGMWDEGAKKPGPLPTTRSRSASAEPARQRERPALKSIDTYMADLDEILAVDEHDIDALGR